MINIVELPSGEVITISKIQFDRLIDHGVIFYVTSYGLDDVGSYCYFSSNRQQILDICSDVKYLPNRFLDIR